MPRSVSQDLRLSFADIELLKTFWLIFPFSSSFLRKAFTPFSAALKARGIRRLLSKPLLIFSNAIAVIEFGEHLFDRAKRRIENPVKALKARAAIFVLISSMLVVPFKN
jgi:hypothetical protein